jgi:uncharacterized protein (TIGR00297 family)
MTAEFPHGLIPALILSGLIGFLSCRAGFLTRSGAVAAFFLGTAILWFGGWEAVFPLLTFFVSSSLLSKARARSFPLAETAKSSRRDAAQVLANGGVAGLLVTAQALSGFALYPAFLGAVAAANADTWSTELGILFGRNPRALFSRRAVPPGTSGGVTSAGFIAALLGAILIAWVGSWSASAVSRVGVWAVVAAGFVGSFCDSLLGAFWQRRNLCTVCGKTTEDDEHCDQKSVYVGGIRWLNNDIVNLFSTICGALCAGVLAYLC